MWRALFCLAALLPAAAGLSAEFDGGAASAARRQRLDQRPKQIFAHYMGCYPVGAGGIEYARRTADRTRSPTRPSGLSTRSRRRPVTQAVRA